MKVFLSFFVSIALVLFLSTSALAGEYTVIIDVDGKPVALTINTDNDDLIVSPFSAKVRVVSISEDAPTRNWATVSNDSWIAPLVAVAPTTQPAVQAIPSPVPTIAPTPTEAPSCDPSYPGICIPPNVPDLNCGDIPYKRFQVLPPDPHRFDNDNDGIGCEG